MSRIATVAIVSAVIISAGSIRAEDVSVETMPPSVVKTSPASGDTKVPATTKEITVTFSKDMMTKQMWSWCMQSPATFPKISNPKGVKYLQDKRTCVLPVTLEPGKTYVIWINNQKSNAFRDTNGKSSAPYLIVFTTAK
jgi:hypothetical protein